MIFFVSPAEDSFEISEYLQIRGRPLADYIKPLSYEEIALRGELPLGTYIFAAIDQLSPTQREITALCWRELSRASPQITLLNHPEQVLCRYQLLETCFRLNRNSFRAFRAADFLRCKRFPVFLRTEREHSGSLSGLLYSMRGLLRALAKALAEGYRLSDLMIVEYCDAADSAGVFRKYSAYIVGKTIVPNSIVHSDNWVTKWAARFVDPELVQQEVDYVENNPHAEWLGETFAIARIGFGRIDYGLKDSVPQVWEINTNPTFLWRIWDTDAEHVRLRQIRNPVRQRFLRRLDGAFAAINSSADPARTVQLEISESQLKELEAEKRLRSRILNRRVVFSRATNSFFTLLHRLRLK